MSFLGIQLSEGISRRNMASYCFIALISSGYAGLLAMLEPGLLQELDIPYDQQGPLTGNLRVAQEIVYILMLGVYGALADRIGRRVIYVFGLTLTGIGYAIYPFASSVSELFLYRLVIAFGGAAVIGMMVTVIADYSRDETRGRANGLQGVMATFGAFIPPLLGFMPNWLVEQGYGQTEALRITFAAAGSLGIVGALAAMFGLAPRSTNPPSTQSGESMLQRLRAGLHEARSPHIRLSYAAAFISRGDLAVTGAFLGLWLVQWGRIEMNMSTSEAMANLAAPRVLIVVTGALLGSIIMGYISDKVSRVTAVSLASGLAAAVYIAMFFVDDPTAPWVQGLLLLMGIAEISAFVSSQALVGQYAPAARRGAVIGFFGAAGAVGILVASGIGGWSFQAYGPASPFVLFGFLNLLVFIASLVLRAKN